MPPMSKCAVSRHSLIVVFLTYFSWRSSLGGVMKKAKGEATSRCPTPPAATVAAEKAVVALRTSASQATEHAVAVSPDGIVAACEAAVAPAPSAPARGAGALEPLVEQAMMMSPIRQPVQPSPETFEAASAALGRLCVDLLGGDGHAMEGRLGLISGWLLADESARASRSQASAAAAKG